MNPTSTGTLTDIDGFFYKTVKIGKQIWMAENLKAGRYRNGDLIPHATEKKEWSNLTTGAYCYFENNLSNVPIYGRLYNWYALIDIRNIAPQGWHVPTDEEWQILVDYLGRDIFVGGKLKESGTAHWNSPNKGATDSEGFSALPGGWRDQFGNFNFLGSEGNFWSATECDNLQAWLRSLYYGGSGIEREFRDKKTGYSVRLLKDSSD